MLDEILAQELKRANLCFLNSDSWAHYTPESDHYWYGGIRPDEVRTKLGPVEDAVTEAQLRIRLEKTILQIIQQKLIQDPGFNRSFKDKVDWPPLAKLLTMVRLKELARVKIVKKGGRGKGLRYDVAELANTFYGKKLMTELEFGRRHMLDATELEKVRAACLQIKLDLPEVIEPTTTERYFQDEAKS